MILDEKFLTEVKGKKHYHWENTGLPTLDWFSAIDNLELVAQTNPEAVTGLRNLGCIVHEIMSDKMAVHQEFQNYLMDLFERPVSCHIYTSFTSFSEVFPLHSDHVDVYLLSVLGDTEFTVDDPLGKKVYNLIPGDMVYVPAGMMHGAKPITPRICLSYGIEKIPQ